MYLNGVYACTYTCACICHKSQVYSTLNYNPTVGTNFLSTSLQIWDNMTKRITATVKVVPRPTQPSIPPESVNEDQLWLERHRQVWFIPFMDKCVGVQVKLCNPSTMRAIPERFCSEVPSLRGTISSV